MLLDALGRGGMGQVYLASREGLGGVTQLSVIKTLRAQHATDAEYISRFEDEAKTVVQLSHKNVAQVFDIGIIDGTYYMAMELVRGVDLDTLNAQAREAGSLPPGEGIYIIAEVLEALGYAHRFKDPLTGEPLNIVHRDVSPHNVMVSYEGEVKLIDFGLSASKLKKTETAPQVVMGKLLYMAPEQARDDPLDGRSDLYAVGIMLAEVLSGHRYYEGMSAQAVWAQVGTGFRSPVLDQLPPRFQHICEKATARDVNARYISADAFRADLLAAARAAGWHSGSSELRSTLGRLLQREEETFRNRVRDAVHRSNEQAPASDATVVTAQPTTQVTTIASSLGSALSSTSSGDVANDDGGVYATSSPRAARDGRSPVPEPPTGDTAVIAMPAFDEAQGPPTDEIKALTPDEPTEHDQPPVAPLPPAPAPGPAVAPPPAEAHQTVRIERVAAPSASPARGKRVGVAAAAAVLLAVVIGGVVMTVGDERALPPGPTSTAVTASPPQMPRTGEQAAPAIEDTTEGEVPAAPVNEGQPAASAAPPPAAADDEVSDEQAAPAAEQASPAAASPVTSPEAPAPRPKAKTAERPRKKTLARRSSTRGAKKKTAERKAKSVSRRSTLGPRPARHARPIDLVGHLNRYCGQLKCTKDVRALLGSAKDIQQVKKKANACIDTCHAR
jgi:serine/threonine protein kinase